MLGERADPLALVDRIGAGLEVARDDPVASMLEAVATAAGASYAAVRDVTGRELATLGDVVASTTLDVPLVHGGAELGVLSVGPRGVRLGWPPATGGSCSPWLHTSPSW